MVLDISWFKDEHPGGKFSIEMNKGRDVSKYFYGGYSLENIDKVQEHTHSNDARAIVNQLVVGRLVQKAPRNLMKI
jgi:cytochrome b involved in lipid metabolism